MSNLVYGIDRELSEKNAAKYSVQREQEVKAWIEQVLSQKIFAGDFLDTLKDGKVLVNLANRIKTNSCKLNESQMPFKQMENINSFLTFSNDVLKVPKSDQFQTVDLFEKKNPTQVLDSLYAFARHAHAYNASIPLLGPKLADKHEVEFSKEKLEAGKAMPTMQSGYHASKLAQERGATQSGMNYGVGRQISDNRIGSGDSNELTMQSGYVASKLAQERGATQSGINYGVGRQISDNRIGTGDANELTMQSGYVASKLAQERGATQSGLNYGLGRQIADNRVGTGDGVTPTQVTGHEAAINAQQRGATQSGISFARKRDIINN